MNFETWSYAYHNYLLEIRNIFATRFSDFFPEFETELYSPEFFEKFKVFLWEVSSKRISRDIELRE